MLEAFSYAYNADGTLSQSDYSLVLKLGELGEEWNNAIAPLAADLMNDEVTAEEWLRRSKARLVRVNTVLLKIRVTAGMIKAPGTAKIAQQIAEVNGRIRDSWEEIANALASGDNDAFMRATAKARAASQQKINVGLPVMSRLREKLGDRATEAAMNAAIASISSQVGTKFYSPVSWESINRAPPTDPSIAKIQWSLSLDNMDLSIEHPETGEWVLLRYQGTGTSARTNSTGKMFIGQAKGGCTVQVTLIGKPAPSPTKHEFSAFFTTSSRERIFYGDCPDKLKACYDAQR